MRVRHGLREREREREILRRIKRAIVREICGVKLFDKRTKDFMGMLRSEESMKLLARANGVWR